MEEPELYEIYDHEACYYDADDLKDVKGWLKLADQTPKVRGLMYTPWQKKYELLPAFGDLVK